MASTTLHPIAAAYNKSGNARQIKFPDGTMIVMDTTTVTSSASGGKPYAYNGEATATTAYLQDFIDDNFSVVCSLISGSPENANAEIQTISRSGIRIRMGIYANSTSLDASWMAIGRWK